MDAPFSTTLGISAIATYEPPWRLSNDWFGGAISRKFVHHTGIETRGISAEDEVTMAVRATRNLQREVSCDLRDCAAVIFASPSFVPVTVAGKHLGHQRFDEEPIQSAARRFVRRMGISECFVAGINWFCSGYSKALCIACRRLLSRQTLDRDQYVLIVTASRISRITDFSCKQTGALFGDMATVTLVARTDSQKFPVRFVIRYADAEKQSAGRSFFDFQLRENVLLPSLDGGQNRASQRLVFSLDGMGIADVAPRAMSGAVAKALQASHIRPEEVRFVVPHQAGTGIVRFTGMKLEELGIHGTVINGLTKHIGNVSSCSVPYALKQNWDTLHGTIACPTAAVGAPGKPEILQGCTLLIGRRPLDRIVKPAA
jgi:3-oxoacyl-[acyl-carrier-protein] synthase III